LHLHRVIEATGIGSNYKLFKLEITRSGGIGYDESYSIQTFHQSIPT